MNTNKVRQPEANRENEGDKTRGETSGLAPVRRGPGGGRKPKHISLVNKGADIALNAYPEAMQAAVKKAMGGTYPATCPKCGAKHEVDVPGDKELLKLIIERVGGKTTASGGTAAGDNSELTNGQLVKYAKLVVDWMDAVANVDTRTLEREIARMPEQPELDALPHDQPLT